MIFWELLIGFLKVGCFSFGGGYAAIPLIRDVVLSYGWLSEDMVSYMIAVSESTPGPIMINMATYVGASQAGIPGAALATLAVVLPCFFLIILITALLGKLIANRYVQATLNGFKPAMIGIILATGVYMILENCLPGGVLSGGSGPDVKALALEAVLAAVYFGVPKLFKKNVSPILLIVISAVLGAALLR